MKKNEAVALYTFEAEQAGDLGFKKGDIITVLKKTESDNDWWYVLIKGQLIMEKTRISLTTTQDWHDRYTTWQLPEQLCKDEGMIAGLFKPIKTWCTAHQGR